MKTGKLRKRIAVQAEQRTDDGAGGYALAWTTLATVWANVEPLRGNENYTHGRLEGRVTHRITLRWRDDLPVTTDMRLLMDSRVFNVRAVLNEGERNRWTVILAEEGVAA
ncbi:MAG: phage head closure protein [Alphaproteobacteria bacterium]|nr:phage head closure protein [Alphaproteobacteria bacterium]